MATRMQQADRTHRRNVDLARETAMLSLTRSRLWTRRQVDTDSAAIGADADQSMLFVSKDILVSPELQAIARLDTQIDTYMLTHAFPSFMRKGVYLVPRGMVLPLIEKLEAFADQRHALTEQFLEAYPGKVREARERLKALFNANDYPSVAQMRSHFAMQWRFYEMGVPALLKEVKASLWEKERQKAAQDMQDLRGKMEQVLRGEFAKLIEHLVDRLTPDTDGRPKQFKKSMLENFGAYLEVFEARNVVQDSSLAALVKKAKDLVEGVEVQTLRTDAEFRGKIQAQFAQMKQDLDPLVEKRPARRILLNKPAEEVA